MSKRRSFAKKFDLRIIKEGVSYTIEDISRLYGLDKSTVHKWVREENLITIDDKRPSMVYCETLRQFIEFKNKALKMPQGEDGELPCFKCHLKRKPLESQVILKQKDVVLQMQGICEICGTKMSLNIKKEDEFKINITWGYEVVESLPKFILIDNFKPIFTTTSKERKEKAKFEYKKILNFCPENERIKHEYFDKIINRFGRCEETLRQIIYSINLFEKHSKYENFKKFNYEVAKNFKKHAKEKNIKTTNRILCNLKGFFLWLKEKDGYKKLEYDDIKTLEISLRDCNKLNVSAPKDIINLEKIEEIVLNKNPISEREERAKILVVFLLQCCGVRIQSALKTKIGNLNLEQNYVYQEDPKTGRPQKTDFLKFRTEFKELLVNWTKKLKETYGFTNEDPLFPAIQITPNGMLKFEKNGFKKEFIKPNAIREDISKLFEGYNFTPHTVKHSLTHFFFKCGLTREQEKALSQNLGHKDVYTTCNSYYNLNEIQKTQIIENLDIEEMKNSNQIKENPEYKYILSQMKDEKTIKEVFRFLASK